MELRWATPSPLKKGPFFIDIQNQASSNLFIPQFRRRNTSILFNKNTGKTREKIVHHPAASTSPQGLRESETRKAIHNQCKIYQELEKRPLTACGQTLSNQRFNPQPTSFGDFSWSDAVAAPLNPGPGGRGE